MATSTGCSGARCALRQQQNDRSHTTRPHSRKPFVPQADAQVNSALLRSVGRSTAAAAAACTLLLGSPVPAALAIPQTSTCATELCDGNDYSGKDLTKEYYTKGSVKFADFTNSNLERVSLFGANLTGAKLVGANLTYADLGQANLTKADLSDARLEGAIVSSTIFDNVTIVGTDFTDTIIRKDINDYLCSIASGTNPTTGVETRDSLLCE